MKSPFAKIANFTVLLTFVVSTLSISKLQAGEVVVPIMPKPGTMVSLSPIYSPAFLNGVVIHEDNALQFDFLIHKGDGNLDLPQKNEEYTKLVKYFLASLTIPDSDQWVNLSPYEHDRIIKDNFGKTEMGRDLLAQDYLLKQITSSLMYPESGLGKEFWNKVYERAAQEFGNVQVPVNTFNKVWIVPDEALVYESGNTAYVVKSHLKVMLEEDYLSLEKHAAVTDEPNKVHAISSKMIREIILPALEKEVNEGKNFAQLRQIFSGMVLATWYKKALKESMLGKIYADKAKVIGVNQDPTNNEKIYQQYLVAFKKGVYNYIKEDVDKYTKQIIPRKYFSGGFIQKVNEAMVVKQVASINMAQVVDQQTDLAMIRLDAPDAAMASKGKGTIVEVKDGKIIVETSPFKDGKATNAVFKDFGKKDEEFAGETVEGVVKVVPEVKPAVLAGTVEDTKLITNDSAEKIEPTTEVVDPAKNIRVQRAIAAYQKEQKNSAMIAGSLDANIAYDNIAYYFTHLNREQPVVSDDALKRMAVDVAVFSEAQKVLLAGTINRLPNANKYLTTLRLTSETKITPEIATKVFDYFNSYYFTQTDPQNLSIDTLRQVEPYLPYFSETQRVLIVGGIARAFAPDVAKKIVKDLRLDSAMLSKLLGLIRGTDQKKKDTVEDINAATPNSDPFRDSDSKGFKARFGEGMLGNEPSSTTSTVEKKKYRPDSRPDPKLFSNTDEMNFDSDLRKRVVDYAIPHPKWLSAYIGRSISINGDDDIVKIVSITPVTANEKDGKKSGYNYTIRSKRGDKVVFIDGLTPKSTINSIKLWDVPVSRRLLLAISQKLNDGSIIQTAFDPNNPKGVWAESSDKDYVTLKPGIDLDLELSLVSQELHDALADILSVTRNQNIWEIKKGPMNFETASRKPIAKSVASQLKSLEQVLNEFEMFSISLYGDKGKVLDPKKYVAILKDGSDQILIFMNERTNATETFPLKSVDELFVKNAMGVRVSVWKNQAMSSKSDKASIAKDFKKGGIDLNGANLNFEIKRDGKGVPLPLPQQDMELLNKIQGFVPTIIEIKPVTTLPMFSQLHENSTSQNLASAS